MAAEPTLTAGEAAAYLGVSRATLYAYVSRGLVASQAGPGPSRARRYPRGALDDFRAGRERRRDRTLAAHGALHWGLPVLDSQLTLIEGGRLFYRGRDALGLAATTGFEGVAALLWTGDDAAAGDLFAPDPTDRDPVSARPPGARLAEHLAAAAEDTVVTLGSSPGAALRAAARAVEGLFGAAGAVGAGPLAARLARGWGTARAGDLDAALVLSADHELNVSAFTARCVASADARVEHVLLAALCALRGRRHGGVIERVEALLAGAARQSAPRAADLALADDGGLPGFGHPLYPDGDPRGDALVRLSGLDTDAAEASGGPAEALVALARDQLGLRPTLDFGLVALSRHLGLGPGAAFELFALGRSAGWVAHALEAWGDRRLIRPRSRYTGPAPA